MNPTPEVAAAPPYKIKQCRHGPMLFNTRDVYIGRSLELYGEYCESEIKLLLQLCRPDDLVLDIGANIGADTVPLARHVGQRGHVVAFEPQRLIHQMLCANLALNALGNVTALWFATGASAGEVVVPPINYAAGGNFGGISMAREGRGERVAVRPIDALNLPRCALIKIDVEGMELEVLQGAAKTIARFQPSLYVENDGRHNSPALIGHLLGLGYRLFWHLPPLFSADNFNGSPENVFPGTVCVNMLCLPLGDQRQVGNLRPVAGIDDTGLQRRPQP